MLPTPKPTACGTQRRPVCLTHSMSPSQNTLMPSQQTYTREPSLALQMLYHPPHGTSLALHPPPTPPQQRLIHSPLFPHLPPPSSTPPNMSEHRQATSIVE